MRLSKAVVPPILGPLVIRTAQHLPLSRRVPFGSYSATLRVALKRGATAPGQRTARGRLLWRSWPAHVLPSPIRQRLLHRRVATKPLVENAENEFVERTRMVAGALGDGARDRPQPVARPLGAWSRVPYGPTRLPKERLVLPPHRSKVAYVRSGQRCRSASRVPSHS